MSVSVLLDMREVSLAYLRSMGTVASSQMSSMRDARRFSFARAISARVRWLMVRLSRGNKIELASLFGFEKKHRVGKIKKKKRRRDRRRTISAFRR